MSTIRKTTYRCDACGQEVEKRGSLVQFRIERGQHSANRWNDTVIGAKADFCDLCEHNLLVELKSFFGETAHDLLRRKPPRAAKKPKSPVQG